ncbi:HD domain-containing protein [Aphelenchoides besseyi]|nr:HD domain-containing protein [Aphelenchoides besseyi]
MVKDWLEVIARTPTRSIVDNIHDTIALFYPLSDIIDTRPFQRLRQLKQTGAANYVFPCAEHSRFEHSLGVYHLALRWMMELRKSESVWISIHISISLFRFQPLKDESKITGADVLCVALAGLIHDLGHGPFSHTYDGVFLERMNTGEQYKHEKGSEMMFEYLLAKYPRVKQAILDYMTDDDLMFVYELINPPKSLVKNGQWMPKYRSKEKAFLFDIVSNPEHGLDVDKLDYFLRDSKAANVGISFHKTALDRICNNMQVRYSEARQHKGIAFDEKVYIELESTFTCRMELHAKIYQHKTVLACQHLLVDILCAADPFIEFYADDGRCYRMSDAFKDMSAFCQLDDRVLYEIERSRLPEMKEAQRLYQNLLDRKQARLIGKWKFRNDADYKKDADKVTEFLVEKGISQTDILFQQTFLHRGLGLTSHPLHKVDLYHSKRHSQGTKQMADCQSKAGYSEIYVYLTNPEDFGDERYYFLGDSLDQLIESEINNQIEESGQNNNNV